MSILRCLPGEMNKAELASSQFLVLRMLQQQKIIQALSVALTINLSEYQANLIRPKYAAVSLISKKEPKNKLASDNIPAAIQILSDGEQQIVRKKQILISQKEKTNKLGPMLQQTKMAVNVDKTIQHHPTSDENHIQQQKGTDKTKQIKKKKKDIKLVTYSAHIPKVDLIQTCYLPRLGLSNEQIMAKKVSLLKRKAENLPISHPKNQKRQIRMLSS